MCEGARLQHRCIMSIRQASNCTQLQWPWAGHKETITLHFPALRGHKTGQSPENAYNWHSQILWSHPQTKHPGWCTKPVSFFSWPLAVLFYLSIAKHTSGILEKGESITWIQMHLPLYKLLSGGKESEKVSIFSKSIKRDGGHWHGLKGAEIQWSQAITALHRIHATAG